MPLNPKASAWVQKMQKLYWEKYEPRGISYKDMLIAESENKKGGAKKRKTRRGGARLYE